MDTGGLLAARSGSGSRILQQGAGNAGPKGVLPAAQQRGATEVGEGNPPEFSNIRINEIRIGGIQSSVCNESQVFYVEISGTPGASLNQLALIQLGEGDVEGNSGVVERMARFVGKFMPPDGRLVVVGQDFCLPGVQPDFVSQSVWASDPDNNTFILVRNPTVVPGVDLDINNDCELDSEPWSLLIDAVAFQYEDLPNCVYSFDLGGFQGMSKVFGPQQPTGAPPMHAYRCQAEFPAWLPGVDVYGVYQPGVPSAFDTPGEANPLCEDVVCPASGKCCEPHGGIGCEDSECCQFVCAVDDRCCSIAWDAECAALATNECNCNPDPFAPLCPDQPDRENCFLAHGTPGCDQSACEIVVCDALPQCCVTLWDQQCALTAYELCACGNPLAPPCTSPHAGPGCRDCNCCTKICEFDSFCCIVQWDEACAVAAFFNCVTCGSSNAESCCTIHQTPACSDAACCAQVCSVFIDCCIASWDFDCAVLATQLCPPCDFCGDPASAPCTVVHSMPGCSDAECCVRVCTIDPYCCGVTWDAVCVATAQAVCFTIDVCDNIGSGVTCFEAHPMIPGCSDQNCCSAVCTVDVLCCDVGWDTQCVALAQQICSPFVCGSFSEGSCMLPSGLPGCDYSPCCLKVCGIDPACCLTGWDSDCVDLAFRDCCGLPGSGSCFSPNGSPFCEDPQCCSEVCNQDLFCCAEIWDFFCAELAGEVCDVPCVDVLPGIRSCYIPHAPGGCEDANLCRTVCTIDPYCCERVWDALCVQEALAFPHGPFFQVCPAILGGCLEPHPGPGCTDEQCCKAVCSVDTACCSVAWDLRCAEQAIIICESGLFPFPPPCPGEGDCFEQLLTPGCEDQVCCTVVCQLDASCCNNAWDFMCVFLADSLCDDFLPDKCLPSAESCFSAHETPYCRSADCSDAVCVFDGFCCEESWDGACVNSANVLCAQGSGSLLAGECFEPHPSPGCSDWACSERVCFDDAFCCIFVWDALCADLAVVVCRSGPCFSIHDTAGCASEEIMLFVCGQLPDCCQISWDQECRDLAQEKFLPLTNPRGPGFCTGALCVPDCGDEEAGDCFVEKLTPNCADQKCCTNVCFSDTLCCTELWDEICVFLAKSICADLWADETFPAGDVCAGPCFIVKNLPNCSDADCSKLVCLDLPSCCETEWDLFCVEQAFWACRDCGDKGTGDCCSSHPTPYCNDEDCCEEVCLFDPFCCSLGGAWDFFCVEQARSLCPVLCPVFGCGDPSTGSCFSSHPSPFCSDEVCCDFVCGLVEPFCCEVVWDDLCVQIAQFFCP
jgi:hypothetical protein